MKFLFAALFLVLAFPAQARVLRELEPRREATQESGVRAESEGVDEVEALPSPAEAEALLKDAGLVEVLGWESAERERFVARCAHSGAADVSAQYQGKISVEKILRLQLGLAAWEEKRE